jgi:hypothetical protein
MLVPAAGLFTLLHWRQHGFRPAIPVFIWVAAFLVANLVLPLTAGFPGLGMVGRIPITVLDHVPAYRYTIFSAHLYPFPWDRANDLYHVLAAVLMLVGLTIWGRDAFRRYAVAFCGGYVALLMVVPVIAGRYMWVVYPIFAFGLVRGLTWVAGLLRPSSQADARARLALAAAAVLAVLNVAWAERPAARGPAFTALPEVQQLFGALTTLAAEQPVRVAFVRPQVLALQTGIPSMPTFRATPEVVTAELDRLCITHVVLGDLDLAPRTDAAFRETVRTYPDSFRLEYSNARFELQRYTAVACQRDLRTGWRPQR